MNLLSAVYVIKVSILFVYSLNYTPLIKISQGNLLGFSTNGGSFRKYYGIPYGTIIERYQAPGPPPQWFGTFNASDSNIYCPQYNHRLGVPTGDENCLMLNIFTPGTSNPKLLLPVMVFFLGNSLHSGSYNSFIYNPEPLIRRGVIVVTVNYRLGAFGFLCLNINGAPGNAGLKDHVAALKWIKNNIQVFGGTPNSITVFGGGIDASVNYLLLSSEAKGLFDRVVIESSTSLSPFAFCEEPVRIASSIASKMGYITDSPHELLNIFNNSTKNKIVMATVDRSNNPLSGLTFGPCAEKQAIGTYPFISASPKLILESGNFNKVPLIIGYNSKDGLNYAAKFDKIETLNNDFGKILPHNLKEKKAIINEVKIFYFGEGLINKDMIDNLTDYFSDVLFHYPSILLTDYLLENASIPVHNYYFRYDSYRNMNKILNGLKSSKGAAYGDELFYLFQPTILWPLPVDENDEAMLNTMASMWTNFAKYSDPTPIQTSFEKLQWKPSKRSSVTFLTIDRELKMITVPNRDRVEFWKYIYSKYGN